MSAMTTPTLLPMWPSFQPEAWISPDYQHRDLLAFSHTLAAQWPDDASHIFPQVEDRIALLVVLLAAWQRGLPVLLPPSGTVNIQHTLRQRYPKLHRVEGLDLRDLAALPRLPAPVPVSISADQLAVLAFTSGSTGQPQAHEKPWQALVATARLAAERLYQDASVVATVPAQHLYGLETTVMMGLVAGCQLHPHTPSFPADIAAALWAMPEPRVLITTPVHLRALLVTKPVLPPLQRVVSATAPLPLAVAEAFQQQYHTAIHEIYGCTEAGSLATRCRNEGDLWWLYDGLSLHHSTLHAPYLPAPVPLPDVLEVVSERHFRLLGRSSEVLKVGGKRMALPLLTEALLALPEVADAIVWVPDPEAITSRPAALVVAKNTTAERLLQQLAESIEACFLPRPLKIVESLPRNAVGKLPHATLMALL